MSSIFKKIQRKKQSLKEKRQRMTESLKKRKHSAEAWGDPIFHIDWDKVFKAHPEISRTFKARIRNVEDRKGMLWDPDQSGPDSNGGIVNDELSFTDWTGTYFQFEMKGEWREFVTRRCNRGDDDCVLWGCRFISEPFAVTWPNDPPSDDSEEWEIAAHIVQRYFC